MESAQTKPRIRIGRTETYVINEMDFQHEGKTLTAVHPFYGPADSRTLQNLIRKNGDVEPTAPELTSFVHEYFDGEESQAEEVNQIMKDKYFKGFTGILYVPEKGALGKGLAYFIDNPKFDRDSIVNRDNLLKRLDENRAQVPFEHLKEDFVDWKKVAKHPYFIAWAGGKEGAEKLAELASKHPKKEVSILVPNVSILREPIAKVAMLSSSEDSNRLIVSSRVLGDYEYSYAFGVLK